MERDAFLARTRRAVATSSLPVHEYRPGPLVGDLGIDDRLDRFRQRLDSVAGVTHDAADRDEAAAIVPRILREHEATDVLSWDRDELPVPELADSLPAEGFRFVSGDVPPSGEARAEHLAGYMHLAAGLTGADAGLAESGSIVLRTGPGRPRMASLIPLVHVAILPVDRIHESLSHYMASDPGAVEATSNLVFVTGPSRTGDIEMVLNLGVHGPMHLHVVLLHG